MLLLVAGCALGLACSAGGAEETTDLFLVDLWADENLIRVGEPHNITERAGYDNQPSWSEDGKSVFYASRTGNASDIYRFDLDSREVTQVTDTEDKEYSPQAVIGGDGVTAVRLERNNSLRVWRYDADGANAAPLLQAFRETVRYYTWIDEDTVALGVGQNPSALHLARIGDGEVIRIANDVGRSFNRVPGKNAISFVIKDSPADWWIAELNLDDGSIDRIARTLQGIEDHAWATLDRLLMGSGTTLYVFAVGKEDAAWQIVADFDGSEIASVSRLAVSPAGDQLVMAAKLR